MSATAEQLAVMSGAIDSLRARYTQLWVHVNSSAFPAGGRDSAKAALYVDGKSIDFLADEGWGRVEAGSYSFSSWSTFAQSTYAHMSGVAGFTDKWNFTGFSSAVAVEASATIGSWASWALPVAVLVLLAVILGQARGIAAAVKGG